MSWIVDTSVVLKWAIREPGSEAAKALIGEELFAPDLLQAELAHVLSRRSRAGEFDAAQAFASQALIKSSLRFVRTGWLSRRALELSLELGHPATDCLFLAVAEAGDQVLITADEKFVSRFGRSPYAALVTSLGG